MDFFLKINTSVFGLLEFVLLLYWGLISLPATTGRDGIHFSASDVMGSISDSLYYYFFWLRIHGLAVSELPIIYWAHHGLGFVVIFFFFQILVQIFLGFFFFA